MPYQVCLPTLLIPITATHTTKKVIRVRSQPEANTDIEYEIVADIVVDADVVKTNRELRLQTPRVDARPFVVHRHPFGQLSTQSDRLVPDVEMLAGRFLGQEAKVPQRVEVVTG